MDWEQRWFSFQFQGAWITLQGELRAECAFTVMSIDLHNSSSSPTHIPKAHALLDKFSTVFEEPKGLPPRRDYDHIIRLIPGARLVAIRPYRVALI